MVHKGIHRMSMSRGKVLFTTGEKPRKHVNPSKAIGQKAFIATVLDLICSLSLVSFASRGKGSGACSLGVWTQQRRITAHANDILR